ncbi:hypothetical protein [Vitiosangium sp. GDMCC 1.1324]|uniref:hypothetical protein n=1 Tax=Vitiosangium sp. (strain GDMCC 1.1324) TaxID=2138576 RepID=UPI000D3A5F85|nr:hypothetical protein [Vitiosangium sp. GDMCC 1.1324]PTL76528.1 hypothetical protein DAT35_48805 [Vitiosangium sp. GDMCC 1.1324]
MNQHPLNPTEANARRKNRALLAFALAGAAALCVTLPKVTHATPGGAGWQGKYTLSIPAGRVDQFVHYPCPAAYPVAVSGGFLPNAAAKAGMVVLGNGPRLDLSPTGYNEWSWIIDWPNGAPAGSVITFDVYCVAGPQ